MSYQTKHFSRELFVEWHFEYYRINTAHCLKYQLWLPSKSKFDFLKLVFLIQAISQIAESTSAK